MELPVVGTIGHLAAWQKAEIGRLIELEGFNPLAFKWDLHRVRAEGFLTLRPRLSLTGTEYYFEIAWNTRRSRHGVAFSPGREARFGGGNELDWDLVTSVFTQWLFLLKNELQAVDPWSLYQEEQKVLEAASTSRGAEELFTEEEQRLLTARLDEFERAVREVRGLSPEEQEFLSREIGELKEEVKQLRRWGWTKFMFGTVWGILSWLEISPSDVQGALSQVFAVLQGIFAGNPPQLP